MSQSAWGLPPCLLDKVSPFHLVLGPDLTIRQVGSSLRRVCPQVVPGSAFESVVEIISPRGPVTAESLRSRSRSLFVLQLKEGDLKLRGQVLHDEASDVVIFVGTPWITDMGAISELNLTLEDFSVSDNVVDYLLMLQTQGAALVESRTMAASLEAAAVESQARARQLERLTRELDSVLNSAGEGIYGVDAAGTITFVNRAAAQLLRTSREALLGRAVGEVIRMVSADPAPAPTAPVEDEGGARHTIGRHRRVDGSLFDSESISAPVLEGDTVVGSVVVFRDISERLAVERLKDEFISMVSHELRTPLTSMRGALGLLAAGNAGHLEPRAARMVEVATVSTDRLVRLINDILDVEGIAAGKLAVHPRRTSALSLVETTVGELAGLAEAAGVQIKVGQVEGTVLADPDRIVQTLGNLVGNAIKFSETGSSVEIAVSAEGDEVRFEVFDSGPGIPADQLEKVFDPFHQVDASDTRQKGGTGLGLAISRGLVERHRGRIWATSELGEGTTVSFTLPAAPPVAERTPAPPISQRGTR
ncbi:MAG TPA: ATP-binding protein [Nocardioides sp.]|nr:ATP-binding protein [Nocardioides sp.]